MKDKFTSELEEYREQLFQDSQSNVNHPTHYNNGIEMWDYAYSHNLDFFEVV